MLLFEAYKQFYSMPMVFVEWFWLNFYPFRVRNVVAWNFTWRGNFSSGRLSDKSWQIYKKLNRIVVCNSKRHLLGIVNDIIYPVAIHCWHTQNAHMTYISAQHDIENERPLEFSFYYYFSFDSVFYDFIRLVKVHVMRRLLMATMLREWRSASAGNSCLKWTLWVQAELELWVVVRAFFVCRRMRV